MNSNQIIKININEDADRDQRSTLLVSTVSSEDFCTESEDYESYNKYAYIGRDLFARDAYTLFADTATNILMGNMAPWETGKKRKGEDIFVFMPQWSEDVIVARPDHEARTLIFSKFPENEDEYNVFMGADAKKMIEMAMAQMEAEEAIIQ